MVKKNASAVKRKASVVKKNASAVKKKASAVKEILMQLLTCIINVNKKSYFV